MNTLHRITLSIVIFFAILFFSTFCFSFERKYSKLVDLLALPDQEGPLCAFGDFQPDFDQETFRVNLEYFNDNPRILQKIQDDLDSRQITWQLDDFSQRLLFVPETRSDYATLFESYCYDVIHYVLDRTKLDNPYNVIITLQNPLPRIPDSGVTVFLVHNLVKESRAQFVFTAPEEKSLALSLRTKHFVGEVGSVKTSVRVRDDGSVAFEWDRYTIWQNNAKNPYTALMVPVEETLHHILREYTHHAIQGELTNRPGLTTETVQEVVTAWQEVEEALVGGLVRCLLPEYLEEYVGNVSWALVVEDAQTKDRFSQYRYLQKGISVVANLGYTDSIRLYKDSPEKFKALLTEKLKADDDRMQGDAPELKRPGNV